MNRISLILLSCCLLIATATRAQLPAYYEPYQYYEAGLELFEKGAFAAAREQFEAYIGAESAALEAGNDLVANAQFYLAASAYYLGRPDAEPLLERFVASYPENTKLPEALLLLAQRQIAAERYGLAQEYLRRYQLVGNPYSKQGREATFLLAYAYYRNEQLEQALPLFQQAKALRNTPRAQDAAYYEALILYQNGNYNRAYNAFDELRDSPKYSSEIRVPLANTLLALKRYDDLFRLADELAADPRAAAGNADVYYIVANAAYERGDYVKAARAFERYAASGGELSRPGNFRFGQSYYKQQRYANAIPVLGKVLTPKWDSLTQIASYYLGFAYLRTNDLNNARVAFEKAAKAPTPRNESVRQDALYQYGKLAFQTRFYEDAYRALRVLERDYPASENIPEVRALIADVLVFSKNYQQAVEYLESVPMNSPRARETYQEAAFYLGTRLYEDENYAKAAEYFRKAINTPAVSNITLSARYWLAETLFRQEEFAASTEAYNTYLAQPGVRQHEYAAQALYGLGWNGFKQKNYTQAARYFSQFVQAADRSTDARLIVDANLRIGDSYFLKRDYRTAIDYYQRVGTLNYGYVDYALYQIGEANYRQKDYQASVQTFDRLIQNYPQSELHDDALDRISEIYATWIKDYERARTYARQLVEKHPQSPLVPDAYNRLAFASYYLNDRNSAIRYFRKVVEDYGSDQEKAQVALENLASLVSADEYDRIFAAYKEKYPDVNQNLAELYYNTGTDRFFAGNYQGAITQFSNYINDFPNGPNYFETLVLRARSYRELAQFDNALSDYELVYTATPRNAYTSAALLEAAEIKYELQQYNQSLQLYQQLLQIAEQPENQTEARFGMAKNHQAMGNYDEALRVLRPIAQNIELNELTRERAELEIGLNQYYQQQLSAALTTFRGLEAKNKTELGARSQYMITQILYDQQQYDAVREAGLYLQENFPTYDYWKAKAFLLIARAYYAQKDYFQAKGVLESIINYAEVPEVVQEAQTLLDTIVAEEQAAGG